MDRRLWVICNLLKKAPRDPFTTNSLLLDGRNIMPLDNLQGAPAQVLQMPLKVVRWWTALHQFLAAPILVLLLLDINNLITI